MRRNYYKYIFFFNFIFISILIIFVFNSTNNTIYKPVSVSTPIINTTLLNAEFCQNAEGAVIIDAKSGAVLYEKNANVRLPMASTTKIMTALCVIEKADLNSIITISKNAANTEGSSIYLKEGEEISVQDLLYGLMLESGNDAAIALAEGCFGSVDECVKYMNQKAHEIGLIDTHFENPEGLDNENHYTTAYELSLITKHALQNDFFTKLVSSKNYTTNTNIPHYFSNHNRLLNSFEGTLGVKTGYTSKSGRCLVSCAKRENEMYLAVTLNCPDDWSCHKEMLEFAFENHESCEVASKDSFIIYNGFKKYSPDDSLFITSTGEGDFNLNYKITSDKENLICEYSTENSRLGYFCLYEDNYQ